MANTKKTTKLNKDLGNTPQVLSRLQMRGVPSGAFKLPTGGLNWGIWAKTYTETKKVNVNSAVLTDKNGKVLYTTSAPLTKEEIKLIETLGR